MISPDRAWLECMYNNRARVADHGVYLARWAERSRAVRASLPCTLDVRYGDGVNETLDVFPASTPGAPVLVFLHGGYWCALDKRDHAFIAPAFTPHGACVVVPNYALCPGTEAQPVSIPDIALQMVRALAWTWRHIAQHGGDPSRITVAGHSAGGQLAALLLNCAWSAVGADLPKHLVRNALSISGLHDLELLRDVPFLETALRLTPEDARRASPALLPPPRQGQLYGVVGGAESAEFLRQNALIRQAWGRAVVPVCEVLPGLHHFSVLDALADPAQRLHGHAMALLQA